MLSQIFNFISQLLTQHGGQFAYIGKSEYVGLATIMVVWFGIKSAFGATEVVGGFHFGRFADLLLMIAFGYAMVNYYNAPIPGLGMSFPQLITNESKYLTNLIGQTALQNAEATLNTYWGRIPSPGITDLTASVEARHFGIDDLIRIGTLTRELANQLKQAVLKRQNVLISGGTGTGKTTLLNILANFIPSEERILVIEDTAEIQIATPNLVRFQARREQQGLPAVTIRELLKASLRHRPDRIILGEIRGGEAFDLLQLLNTGHSGTLSTVHANCAQQALSRFTSCVLQSGVELPYRAIKSNIADSLNLLVHIERRPGQRYVSEVLEMARYDPESDRYELTPTFRREEELCSQEPHGMTS